MSQTQTNGDLPHSQTVDHFVSYPVVNDLKKVYESNSIGAQSIQIFHSLYQNLAVPFFPYLQTPYSIVKPYLEKADSLGDQSLSTVDSHFPAVKNTDLEGLKSGSFHLAYSPIQITSDTTNYVIRTYDDEYKKTGGQGVVTTGKAVISTELRIMSEAMHAVADYLGPKRDQAMEEIEKIKKQGQEQLDKTKKTAQAKKDQAAKQVNSH